MQARIFQILNSNLTKLKQYGPSIHHGIQNVHHHSKHIIPNDDPYERSNEK
jgi:hypothetical protein